MSILGIKERSIRRQKKKRSWAAITEDVVIWLFFLLQKTITAFLEKYSEIFYGLQHVAPKDVHITYLYSGFLSRVLVL